MSLKRTALFVALAGAGAAWLSSAMTPPRPSAGPSPLHATDHQAITRTADLAAEIEKLHERLRPDAKPREAGRDLFKFRAPAARPAPSLPVAPVLVEEAPRPLAPALPPLKLAGIAEDPGADGVVRTAIISGGGQLYLVKVGEAVGSRYRVAAIAADAVELADQTSGTSRVLPLK